MKNSEEKVKDKLLAMLERVVEDPLFLPDEWENLFGKASVMRAMAIVSKLRGRPADEEEVKREAAEYSPMSPEEKVMMRDWLNVEIDKDTMKACHGTLMNWCEDCAPAGYDGLGWCGAVVSRETMAEFKAEIAQRAGIALVAGDSIID